MLILAGLFLASLAVMQLILWRDPFLIRTPMWAVMIIGVVVYGAACAITTIFFLGAVYHGTF